MITFKPFFSVKVSAFPSFILGETPGSGCLLLSICAFPAKDRSSKVTKVIILVFI